MRKGTVIGVGVAVLLFVVGLVVVATTRGDDGDDVSSTLGRTPGTPSSDPFAERPEDVVEPTAGSPEEVATAFLEAEVAADAEASFRLFAAEDREEHGNAAGWEEARTELWQPTDFRLTGTEPTDEATTTVRADVRFEPAIDEYLGVVPSSAQLDLPLVREDGGWRVAFLDSAYEATWPDLAGAPEAVRAWAESHQRCAPEGEWDAGLLDSTFLAESLCDTTGAIEVGRVDTLDALADATPYLNDFGEAAAEWAAVVPVEGPVELDVVAAPLGDRWVVLGASPP